MAKFNFNLRKKKSNSPTPINLVIRWDNNKLVFSTKESIEPRFFETDNTKRGFQRVKETRLYPGYPELNARLDWIESTANTVFRKFLNDNNNESPKPEVLKSLLDIRLRNAQEKEKKSLFSFFEQFIEEGKSRINSATGRVFAIGTINSYRNTLSNLREFSVSKKRRIDYDTIDLDFYSDYVSYLTKEKLLSTNTTGRHIKVLKAVLSDATERNLNTNMAFKSKKFKKISEKIDSIYLTASELLELYNLDLSTNLKLDRVRDLFIVGCWTGLRFSDFTNIEPKCIKGNFIEIKTQKTGESVVIPISSVVKSILNKYSGKTYNSLPRPLSNPKMNEYLKELCKLLPSLNVDVESSITKGGVKLIEVKKKWELVVTHSARRSFSTNLFLAGVPSITIMKITGHRTEKAFMTYIKMTPTENAKLLEQHWRLQEETKNELISTL